MKGFLNKIDSQGWEGQQKLGSVAGPRPLQGINLSWGYFFELREEWVHQATLMFLDSGSQIPPQFIAIFTSIAQIWSK